MGQRRRKASGRHTPGQRQDVAPTLAHLQAEAGPRKVACRTVRRGHTRNVRGSGAERRQVVTPQAKGRTSHRHSSAFWRLARQRGVACGNVTHPAYRLLSGKGKYSNVRSNVDLSATAWECASGHVGKCAVNAPSHNQEHGRGGRGNPPADTRKEASVSGAPLDTKHVRGVLCDRGAGVHPQNEGNCERVPLLPNSWASLPEG